MRLRPVTKSLPKPLIEIEGIALVERLLRQMIAADIGVFTIITGWLGARIEKHIMSLEDLPPAVDIGFFREKTPLGTLGGLTEANFDDRRVVFAFADLLTDLDFRRIVDAHEGHTAELTLASHTEGHRLSLGEILADGFSVHGYAEKPLKEFTICSGIAVMEPDVVASLAELQPPVGFPDLVTQAVERGFRVRHWPHHAYWRDINSLDTLVVAEREWAALCDREMPAGAISANE